jgi:hypothetical protein
MIKAPKAMARGVAHDGRCSKDAVKDVKVVAFVLQSGGLGDGDLLIGIEARRLPLRIQ